MPRPRALLRAGPCNLPSLAPTDMNLDSPRTGTALPLSVPRRLGLRSESGRIAFTLCLLAASAAAHAHTEEVTAGGFVSGLLHPVTGIDHLLAMVAVGIWGAVLGAPLLWALPIVFPLLMVGGGMLGIAGMPLPFVEGGIALSVLLLGLAILAAWRAPVAVAVALVAAFGVLHGHAHGTELPASASPAAYSTGFVLATGALHLAGIGLGELRRLPRGAAVIRAIGAAMAVAGSWMLVTKLA